MEDSLPGIFFFGVIVEYLTGRWFRRMLSREDFKDLWVPEVDDLPPVTVNCWVGKNLLLAPVLSDWFRRGENNYTATDIKWFLVNFTREESDRDRSFYLPRNKYIAWTRLTVLHEPGLVPARLGPEDEWVVYMSWVDFVLSRTFTSRKRGDIHLNYSNWLRINFPEYKDPIW